MQFEVWNMAQVFTANTLCNMLVKTRRKNMQMTVFHYLHTSTFSLIGCWLLPITRKSDLFHA